MKRLTINQVARANLRINKKAYFSLFIGIFLAVFLATATVLCIWGTIRGHEEQMAERVGWMDMFLLGNNSPSDQQLRGSGFFRDLGHVTVNATAGDSGVCAGYYDETAARLMNRKAEEGRLPERKGEIAADRSALSRLNLEKAEVGDTVTLSMHPINGREETRTFTLVGILNEQAEYLNTFTEEPGMNLPALLVSPEETYEVSGTLVHRVLTYAPMITFNQVMRNYPVYLEYAYGVSRETGELTYYDSGWDRARNTLNRVLVWAVLGAALMLASCVGISSAMESLLSRKTEDIGMLRAIGATRRQVRRIYGAEAWVLTATALPAGMLSGILAAWIVSRIARGQVAFALNAWLLVPVLGISALCVFIGSRLPLHRASRQMPMGVLRDTAMLRRAGKIKSRRSFAPSRLIAGRRTRFYPLRQIGAAGMTALTLLCALMLGELALGMNSRKTDGLTAFRLTPRSSGWQSDPFSQAVAEDEMARADLDEIRAIDGVSSVRSVTELTACLLMKEAPEYFRPRKITSKYEEGAEVLYEFCAREDYWSSGDWLYYSAEDLADARARMDLDTQTGAQTVDQMNVIREMLGIEEKLVPIRILVADLDGKELQEYADEGTVDVSRLDSGEQVLVYAPAVCYRRTESGGYEQERWLRRAEARAEEWDEVILNDEFRAGMPLSLLELSGEEDPVPDFIRPDWAEVFRSRTATRTEVTVGAVLSGPVEITGFCASSFTIITTPEGAKAMGLVLPAPSYADVILAADPAPEEETAIESRINQIAIRSWTDVRNVLKENQAYQTKKLRQILLFSGLILLFFAMSVSMQVSGAVRQIRSDTRTIGTLRAVGADLKTLVGCYRLPLWICAAAGLVPSLLFYAITWMPGLKLFTRNHPLAMIPVLAVMAGCIALTCTAGIRGRLAGVTRQSIVDNIREL